MQEEDLSDIINFISLQEIKKNKKSNSERKNDEDDEEDDSDIGSYLLPTEPSNTSSSIETPPTADVIKRRLTQSQAPKGIASIMPGQNSKGDNFAASLTPTSLASAGYGANTIQNLRNRGNSISSGSLPFASPSNALRAMVNSGSLTKMPIAASYDPFNGNQQELTENVKIMRQKILALLKKEPHRTEINKMRSEITGE